MRILASILLFVGGTSGAIYLDKQRVPSWIWLLTAIGAYICAVVILYWPRWKAAWKAFCNPHGSGKLIIHSAFYGTGPLTDVSVLQKLNTAERDGLVIPVDNNFFGCDPAPNQVKRLVVEYSYVNSAKFTVMANEYGRLVLPQDLHATVSIG